MKIKSYLREYEVIFSSDCSFLEQLGALENPFFLIDQRVYELYEEKLKGCIGKSPCYLLEAVETNKNIEKALEIIEQMVEMKLKRNTNLISIGGGIVQDVSGFLANILYRGILWTWVPTTLLAQADSCIGSKTSLNFHSYKNILGYFYPPERIYVNSQFVHTLEERDYRSGLGEMMKCALMSGFSSFRETKGHIPGLLQREDEVLLAEIHKALNFKKAVIEVDEFDTDYRNIMNYGHTFGHALESTSNYNIPHGQAVSYGMLIANEISLARGYLSLERKEEIAEAIGRIVTEGLLQEEYLAAERYLPVIKKDKKYTGTTHTCILYHGEEVRRHSDITDDEIQKACEAVLAGVK